MPAGRRTPYGRAYQARRKALLATRPGCHRCGLEATTADHVPALALHPHVEGSGCCELRPACVPCNMGDGGKLGKARQDRTRRGAGWSAGVERRWV